MFLLEGNSPTTLRMRLESVSTSCSSIPLRVLGLIVMALLLFAHQNVVAEAQNSHQTHMVRTGDTLVSIAEQYNTTVAQLRQLNNLSETEDLYVGHTLIVSQVSVSTPPPARPVVHSACPVSHAVQRGETLWAIANRYDVSLTGIAQANNLSNNHLIRVGQSLCIPGTTSQPSPTPGPSATLRTGPQPQPNTASYTVLGGDTLFLIARAHGVSVQDLIEANGITDPRRLYPGQVLRIPGSSMVETGNTGTTAATDPTSGFFTVQFFNNLSFTGSPVLTQQVAPGTRYDWGLASPGPQVNPDHFTARLEGQFSFEEGLHRFSVTVDDGMRLYVDNNLVHEAWHDQAATTHEVDVHLTAGLHQVRLDYYERTSSAILWLRWQRLTPGLIAPPPLTPVAPMPVPNPPADAFNLQFFNNVDLSGPPVLTQVAPVGKRFDWGTGSPDPQVHKDNFSARMEGNFHFTEGTHRFSVTADDGLRLYVDGELVLDEWGDSPELTVYKDIELTPGSHHVLLEYYERGGVAVMWLRWQPLFPSNTRVPQTAITPPTPGSGTYTEEDKRALFHAILNNDIVTVRRMIASTGFPRFRNKLSGTALHWAARVDALEIMALLLTYPEADPNVRFDNANSAPWNKNRTPLHEAATHGNAAMSELLLAHGADPSLATRKGFTALHFAASSKHADVVEILLKHNVDPNVQEQFEGNSPLHSATRWKPDPEVLEILLRHRGIRPNLRNHDGQTPLLEAIVFEHSAQVVILLDHPDTNPNIRDEHGWTPLYRAVVNENKDLVELLLDNREIDPNKRNDIGFTALYRAVYDENEDLVELLLDHRKTDPNIDTKKEWTPLFRAVSNGDRDIVEQLLEHDDIDAEIETQGWTPLMLARYEGFDRIARMLERHLGYQG
ncbi:MAG: LysM peptidoglycan-binding domain-containing protein [Caldilineaceae bacterium SB0662_bin_9]|uniref:LysM peptidoglycan-binding domain-containing protein n=1 Tax=Caldilineaceae bacterium SB0662_bin_9 TaxID=2605258 RepID=A0A6B1DVN4_9CHLR|nr:ankyrin repeat domain-containing protein [Caldilineaceae bacterium]MYD90762.1 LysM peptidoglycan-binding domain-containing protein [Caldilineaceae bacterium SB0662_bin_9]